MKQQVITWINVVPDLCHHMMSLGHNELIHLWHIHQDNFHSPAVYNHGSWVWRRHGFNTTHKQQQWRWVIRHPVVWPGRELELANFTLLSTTVLWNKKHQINGLVQERHNSIANVLELHLSCTNPSKCHQKKLEFSWDKPYITLTGELWGVCSEYFDGLVQERRNSIANALELRLSCTNPSIL